MSGGTTLTEVPETRADGIRDVIFVVGRVEVAAVPAAEEGQLVGIIE